jgi:PAS domain S-box-containing protein
MIEREELLRREQALGDFGEFILDNEDLSRILQEGCRLIAEALRVDLAKIIEIDRTTNTGLVRAGVGWDDGIVGTKRVDLNERTSEAFAIETAKPVISRDISHEDRFEFPEFLRDHGVRALVNVPILLPGRKPYGLLQVDAREPRDFAEEDISFLRTYAMALGPVIDRLRTVTKLQQSDERLRQVVENAKGYAIVLSDAEDKITDWLAGAEDIFGWSEKEVLGKRGSILFTSEDREHGVDEAELQVAREEGTCPNVRWHIRKDGERVFIEGQTIALKDDQGSVSGFMKIGQDVTARKHGEERQGVLLAELQHRVRNVLAIVQSLVQRTVAGGEPIEVIRGQLEGRISALARTQALLTRELGVGVDLEEIVRDELIGQAAAEEHFEVIGSPVRLAPKAAEVVTLAIHELATNALKYGALRHEGSKLAIRWHVDETRNPPWLRLHWQERGVPSSTGATRGAGFGTELITRRVPYELRGEGRIDHLEDGVDVTLGFPLVQSTSILQTSEPHPRQKSGVVA